MSWHYQKIKTKYGYGLFELYVDEAGEPYARSSEPMTGYYEESYEMIEDLEMMKLDAIQRDVIDDPWPEDE